jgi:hypothetical protein
MFLSTRGQLIARGVRGGSQEAARKGADPQKAVCSPTSILKVSMRRSLPIHSSRLFSTSSSTTRGNVLSKYARRPLPDFPAPSLPPPTTQSTQSPTPSATSPLSPALSLASDTQSSSVQPLSTSSKPVAATAEGEPTKPFTRAVFIPETVPTGEREKRGPEDDAFEVCGVKVPEKPWKPGEEGKSRPELCFLPSCAVITS